MRKVEKNNSGSSAYQVGNDNSVSQLGGFVENVQFRGSGGSGLLSNGLLGSRRGSRLGDTLADSDSSSAAATGGTGRTGLRRDNFVERFIKVGRHC